MEPQFKSNGLTTREYTANALADNSIDHLLKLVTTEDLLARLGTSAGKTSFLVFKHNKYFNVPTDRIAFFYVKHECTYMVCFEQQEYQINHSLEQLQILLSTRQFFRLNRQYLICFRAVKEVEHYFARKLIVKLIVPSLDKLLVAKEKVSNFLNWLENR